MCTHFAKREDVPHINEADDVEDYTVREGCERCASARGQHCEEDGRQNGERQRFQQAPDNSLGFTLMYVMSFELDPFSGLDEQFVEWLWDEYGGHWRDMGTCVERMEGPCRTPHPRLWLTADVPTGPVIHYFALFGCRMTVSL